MTNYTMTIRGRRYEADAAQVEQLLQDIQAGPGEDAVSRVFSAFAECPLAEVGPAQPAQPAGPSSAPTAQD